MANPYSFPTTDEEIWGLILGAPEISSKIPKTNSGLLGASPAEPPQEAYPGQMNLESLDKQLKVLKQAQEIFTPQQTEQPPRQATPQEEKLSAKDIQDRAVLQASPLQGMPQPTDNVPNYLANQGMAGILANKAAYETAPEGEQGDLIRNQANERANLIRGAYRAAGMPLDQYGADNATSRDTANGMDTQRLHALFNAIMPDGKYYRSADQYYDDAFKARVMAGISPRQARKFAQNAARAYQAERVGYLDAVYNNYGRNGYVNNEFAAMILPKIAQDNPMLANFYGNFYAGAKDEYQQQNKLTEKIIDNRNAMGQLVFAANDDTRKTILQALGNIVVDNARQQTAWDIEQQKMRQNDHYKKSFEFFKSNLGLQEYAKKAGIDEKYAKIAQDRLEDFKKRQPGEVEKWYDTLYATAIKMGATPEEAADFAAKNTFAKLTKDLAPKSQSSSASGEVKLTEKQQELYNTMKNRFTQAHNSHSDTDIASFEEYLAENGEKFSANYYQQWQDMLLALKGFQRKQLNDDNGAVSYWSQIRDVNVLEKLYPNFNFDYYWERRGGKPQ